MPDASYLGSVYFKQGSNNLVVASGGQVSVEAGGALNDANGALQRYVDVVITSAQLLALNATPRPLVAAPGAGRALVFEGAIFHKPAGTAYAGIASGEDLSVKYTDASGTEVGQCESGGFLDQTTAQTRYVRATTAASASTAVTPVANAALVLNLLVGEITTGDSPLNVRVFYREIPTVV